MLSNQLILDTCVPPAARGLILSLSGQSSGSPDRVRQIMVLIKTVSKTKRPLFYIYIVSTPCEGIIARIVNR